MAQLVEHNLAKVGVAGSSPVVRSIAFPDRLGGPFFRRSGQVVRQRPAKPLPPVRIRASPPGNIRALRRPFCFTYADMAQLVRAQPCQGWGRGFEPRCPLQTQQPDYYGSRAFSYPSHGLEPEREGRWNWRGRRQAAKRWIREAIRPLSHPYNEPLSAAPPPPPLNRRSRTKCFPPLRATGHPAARCR